MSQDKQTRDTVSQTLKKAPGRFMEAQMQRRAKNQLKAKSAKAELAKLQQGAKTASTPANVKKSKAEGAAELQALRKKQKARSG